MIPKSPKLVLFDLDGTLVDSVPDLHACVNKMLDELDRAPYEEDSVRAWVGNGVDRLVKRVLTNDMMAEPEEKLFTNAIQIFRKHYAQNTSRYSKVYQGVFEGLKYLHSNKIHCACVTNKAEQFTLPLLEKLKLSEWFELIVSGDTLDKCKPDPAPLLHVAATLQLEPADCVMVGDSMHDMKAARAAGFCAVAVPYGYNHGQDITKSNPDFVINSISDIIHLFE